MRLSILKASAGLAILCLTPAAAFAANSYVCAINEVYECVAVTGCSRVSLDDANLAAGIMLLDVEKKQLSSVTLNGEAQADDIEGVTVNDKVILLHGTGKGENDRTWSAVVSLETSNFSAGISTPDASLSLLGKCTSKP